MTAEEALSHGTPYRREIAAIAPSAGGVLALAALSRCVGNNSRLDQRARGRSAASAQGGDGCVVVGLGGDLRHQLGMQHGAV